VCTGYIAVHDDTAEEIFERHCPWPSRLAGPFGCRQIASSSRPYARLPGPLKKRPAADNRLGLQKRFFAQTSKMNLTRQG
jgi:hypothetical protein